MTCQLPAGYDAWRLSAPEDRPVRRLRFVPETVERGLLIEQAGFQLDAVGIYDSSDGSLLSVRIGKDEVAPHAVAHALQLLGLGSWGWDDDLDPDALYEAVAEAAADAEADWADAQRDLRGGY